MRTEATLLLFALSLGGCVSTALGPDLARVRGLSRGPALASLTDGRVDTETEADVRTVLAAPLDEHSAVRVALLNNRELRARLRELGVARGRLLQAGLPANPLVEVEVSPERNTAVEFRVEYELTSLVLAPLRARAAESDLEASRYDAAGSVLSLGYEVRAATYALQAAQQRLDAAQASLEGFAAARDAARAMVQAGNVPELTAATQTAAYERTRVRVAELELERAERRERLQRLLGLHGEEAGWTLAGPLRAPPERPANTERVEVRALEASVELGAMRHRLEALARRTGLARTRGWLPVITADLHVLSGDPTAPLAARNTPQVGAGVSVRLPVFDRQQGTARAYEASFDAAMERYVGLAVDVRSAAREARNRVLSTHARALHYERVLLPAQRAVLEQTVLQFNAMQVGIFALLEARRELLDAELARADVLRAYWTAVAALDALLLGQRAGHDFAPRMDAMDSGGNDDAGGH